MTSFQVYNTTLWSVLANYQMQDTVPSSRRSISLFSNDEGDCHARATTHYDVDETQPWVGTTACYGVGESQPWDMDLSDAYAMQKLENPLVICKYRTTSTANYMNPTVRFVLRLLKQEPPNYTKSRRTRHTDEIRRRLLHHVLADARQTES